MASRPHLEPSVAEPAPSLRARPATVLVLAVWIGLIAGFLDLGLMVAKKRWIDGDFYRLSEHFAWIIPAGVTVLVLVPGMALALVARLRHGQVSLHATAGLLVFVGLLDLSARLPLNFPAGVLLSGGLAVQCSRRVKAQGRALLRIARRTAPVIFGVWLAILLGSVGGRIWSDYRARTTLPPSPAGARNVLLIVWDTVRVGNLSLHGYGRPTTPHLERFAARGVRFDHAFATAPWTLPSHASFFTGYWPHELKVDWTLPLDTTHLTLAEYLAHHGYDTAGFVANLDYCARETGLSRGFAHYEDFPLTLWEVFTRYVGLGHRIDLDIWICAFNELLEKHSRSPYRLPEPTRSHAKRGADINRAFLDWLTWQQSRRRPFFAFLNLNDAHTPYEVPDRSATPFGLRPASCHDRTTLRRWNDLDKMLLPAVSVQMGIDVYDDSIAYLDRQLGLLLDELARRGVLDETLVIVVSDHGEHLGDHLLFFHGCSLYRQLVEVPLVLVEPGRVPAGRIVAQPVSLRDLPTTVVDLLGLGRDAPFPGQSLARFWDPDPAAQALSAETLLMETGKPLLLTNQGREPVAKGSMQSLITSEMHYIRSADGTEELYSLKSDPEERTNLAGLATYRQTLLRCRTTLGSLLRKR
jgi:arylsulfatase A-like enzyme